MRIILYPEPMILPFIKKQGLYLWQSLLVLQWSFLPPSLVTEPTLFRQPCVQSHGMNNDHCEINQGYPIALSQCLAYKWARALLTQQT